MHLFTVTSSACGCSQDLGKEGEGFDVQLLVMQSLLDPSSASLVVLGRGAFSSL